METPNEAFLSKDRKLKISVISAKNKFSNPDTYAVFPLNSNDVPKQEHGQDFLKVPGVSYSASNDDVNWLGRSRKDSQPRRNSREPSEKKKAATLKSEFRAPDGGWGWVVVVASLGISLVADGVSFSFGIIYIEFLHYFGASKSKTSVIGSLFMAVPLMSGPLASVLVDRFGCRSMTIVGGLVSAAGFVASSLADSIEVLCFTFGVLSGLGLGLCYVTAVVCVAFWFEKKRSLANGLGVCGTGVGTFLFAPLTQALIDEYGWRGTTLILAGAFLQMCICGAVMREPDSVEGTFTQNKVLEDDEGDANRSLLPMISSSETGGSYVGRSTASKRGIKTSGAVTLSLGDLPAGVEINGIPPGVNLPSSSQRFPEKGKSEAHYFTKEVVMDLDISNEDVEENSVTLSEDISPVSKVPDVRITMAVKQLPINQQKKGDTAKVASCSQPASTQLQGIRFRRNSITFRSGMLYNPNHNQRASSCPNIYKKSLNSIAKKNNTSWCENFLQIMTDMMDLSMFLEWHFMLLSFSTFLLFTFFIVPYFYLAEHVIGLGYTESEASMLISIIGILNTIGMIALGWAGDQAWMNVTKTYALCLCLCGIFTGVMPLLTHSYPLLATASALFGLFFASNFSFTPVLIVELISLDRFTMAYGLILFAQGLGNLLGPPLAGWLYDITHTWNLSFYLAGIFIFISGLAIALITCTKNFTIGYPMTEGTKEQNGEGISCQQSLLERK